MSDHLDRLESRVDRIADQVAALERRLAAIEMAGAAGGAITTEAVAEPADRAPVAAAPVGARRSIDTITTLSLIGRTLLVFAGAFLLRALTDSGTFEPTAGVLIGIAYACVWIVMADRSGARGRQVSASFHALAFTLIGLPLVFEATLRFRLLSTPASAGALTVFGAIALGVSWRRRLRGPAWIVTMGVIAVTAAMMTLTGVIGPFAIGLVLLGVTTVWFGYVLDWVALRWPVALVVDFTVLVLSARAISGRSADTPAMALVVQVLLLALYLGSFATRTLLLNRDVIPFEVVQSMAALAVGLGGAAYVTVATGVGALPLGMSSLALGLGCYAAALVFMERRQRRHRNFHFYAAAALVFTMTGCALVLPAVPLALTWAACAIVAGWSGGSLTNLTLKVHAVVYAVAAASRSGLLLQMAQGFGLPLAPTWPSVSAADLLTLTAIAATAWIVIACGARPRPSRVSCVPGCLLLTLSIGGVLGVTLAWATPVLVSHSPDAAGMVATLRTAALVAATLALAWAARPPGLVEAGWLVYPLLVLTGVKFVVEDVRKSHPATLFVSFALYGAALILAPRLRRRSAPV